MDKNTITSADLFKGRQATEIMTSDELFGSVEPKDNTKSIYLKDKGLSLSYPETFSTEEIGSFLKGDIYKEPIEFKPPKQLQDIARITIPAKDAEELDPKLFTKVEDLRYGYQRIASTLLEKPIFALIEGSFQFLKGAKKLSDKIRPNYEIEKAFNEKIDGWINTNLDYYSKPEKYGFVSPTVEEKRAGYRDSAYQKNFALGIANDVSESVIDLMSLFIQMGAVKAVTTTKKAIDTTTQLGAVYKRMSTMGVHGFMTTKGNVTERGKAALYRIGYNITPYIANATGATGWGARLIDTGLNTWITSPTYVEAFKEAGGVNKEFLVMAIPQFVMDFGMAYNTVGLPRNQQRVAMQNYLASRTKEMAFKDQIKPEDAVETKGETKPEVEGQEADRSEGEIMIDALREDIVKDQEVKAEPTKRVPPKVDLNKLPALKKQVDDLEDRAEKVDFAQKSMQEINDVRLEFKGRIRKYKDDFLKEELEPLPNYYIAKQGGLSPDEAMEALSKFGINVRDEGQMSEYFKELNDTYKEMGSIVKDLKPKFVSKKETTILKQRLKDVEKGFKQGRGLTLKDVKSIQTELVTLLEKSGLKPDDRAKFMRSIKNIQTEEKLSKELPVLLSRIEALDEAESSRQIKSQIRKALKKTKVKKQGGKPVGKFTPERQVTLDILRESMKLTKAQAEDKLNANLEAIGNETPPFEMVLENRMLGFVSGQNRSIDESTALLKDIQALMEGGREIALLKEIERAETRRTEREDALDTIVGTKTPSTSRIEKTIDKIKRAISNPDKAILGWDNLMNILTEDSKDAPGTTKFEKSMSVERVENAEKRGVRISIEKVSKMALDAFGIKTNRQMIKKFQEDSVIKDLGTFRNTRGEEVTLELSKAEARKIWMEFQDPTLRETFVNEKGNAFSPAMLKAIESSLTKEDMDFATAQLAFYREYYKGVNEVYKEKFGVNLPFNEFYSPISREFESKDLTDEFLKEMNFRRSVTTGSHKSRVINLRPIKAQSDIAVLQKHIIEMEHFKAWADKIDQINNVFTDKAVKDMIDKKFGSEMRKVINNFTQKYIRGGIDRSNNFGAWDMLRVNYTKSALAGKPALFVKQMVSTIAYAETIPTKDFVAGVTHAVFHPKEVLKVLNESELLKARGMNITRDIRDAMNTTEWAAFQKNPSFLNSLMLTTKLGDRGAILLGGWSVYRNALKKTGSPEKAMAEFERVTSDTQQSADLSQLSMWQSGNVFQKMFTMFTSSQNQYYRKERMAISNLIKGKISVAEAGKKILIYHFLLPMMFQLVSDFGVWNKKEQLRAAVLGAANGIFIVNDILDSAIRQLLGMKTFRRGTVAALQFADGALKAMKKITADDITTEDVVDAFKDLSETVGYTSGLPFKTLNDWSEGVEDLQKGESLRGGLKLLGWSPYVIDKNLGSSERTVPEKEF